MRYAPHRLPPQLKRNPPRVVAGHQHRTHDHRHTPPPGAITLGQWAALIHLRPQTLVALFARAGVSGLTPRHVIDRAHIEALSAYLASERAPKTTPIYSATGTQGDRLVVVGALSKAVLARLAASPNLLYELDPRKFEEVVASLLEDQGCKIALTKRTRDGGYDIFGSVRAGLSDVVFLVLCNRRSFTMADFLQDLVDTLGPDKGLRISVVVFDVLVNDSREFRHAVEDPAPDLLAGDLGKPTLDQVQPRGTGGREMQVEATVLGQPQ